MKPFDPLTKPNYFNIILGLSKLNVIDHSESVSLKTSIARNNRQVKRALTNYHNNKDLKLLISELEPSLSSTHDKPQFKQLSI